MNAARVIYNIARADFLERVRRYSFLIMLGLVVFGGYQVAVGNLRVQLGSYRGEYNSAWVGSMLAIIASFFLGWLGFYLVKGSVGRDRQTGVGQIMATTPMSRPVYTLGKWLSNLAVFVAMLAILAIAGVFIQYMAGESRQLDLAAYLLPFVWITLPVVALVAALAVLFETTGFLAGGLGNIVYFFAFIMVIPLADSLSKTDPALEPLGFGLLQASMGAAARAAFPAYDGGFVIGSTSAPLLGIFHWDGVAWTPEIVLRRLVWFGAAALLALAAAIFFDRFDPARRRPARAKTIATASASPAPSLAPPSPASLSLPVLQPAPLLAAAPARLGRFSFGRVMLSELKLLIKGQRWWWYLVAAGLWVAALASPLETVRPVVLPLTWLWPVLVWSGLGSREQRHNTRQMVFSAPAPLWRQLPATWLAGLAVAVVTGGGVALRLLAAGDSAGLLAWASAAVFIPSLALALGIWSGSSKLFEVVYVALWYVGPMNSVAALDYLGAGSPGNLAFFLPLALALAAAALAGRARQVQGT